MTNLFIAWILFVSPFLLSLVITPAACFLWYKLRGGRYGLRRYLRRWWCNV